jgi:hypothetical protein
MSTSPGLSPSLLSLDDPVDGNPFAPEDPRHQIWTDATRDAEHVLHRFNSQLLEHAPKIATLGIAGHHAFTLDLVVGKYDIWANRNLAVVRTHDAIPAYERWLFDYAESWLETIRNTSRLQSEAQIENLLVDLRARLVQRIEHWRAEVRRWVQQWADYVATAEPGSKETRAQSKSARVAQWTEVEIRFLSDERVQLTTPSGTETRNYAEMGFEDGRTKKPTKAWDTFQDLGQVHGVLLVDRSPQGYIKQGKRVQEIRRVLRSHFGLADDPLPLREGSYRAQFSVSRAPAFDS